jgi:hypothetical protein
MEPNLRVPEPRGPPDLTGHLVEEILVRVDAPADLARASAACKAFRRLITDPTFLRRYRTLHPPLLLGFFGRGSTVIFVPAEAPHPNAAAARAFAGAPGFSFSYLPYRRGGWRGCDAHDGRIILRSYKVVRGIVLPELAVCEYDPFTAEVYTLLPPIPGDLLASVLGKVQCDNMHLFHTFFDPSAGYEEAQFSVMCWMCCSKSGTIFIYSSASGSWTHGASIRWDALGLLAELRPHILWANQCLSYANGYLYWRDVPTNKLVRFNVDSMEFSSVSLPSDYESRDIVVVEAGEGRIMMLSLRLAKVVLSLCSTPYGKMRVNAHDHEHPVETTILLPHEYDCYYFGGVAKGYIFLEARQEDRPTRTFFSLRS